MIWEMRERVMDDANTVRMRPMFTANNLQRRGFKRDETQIKRSMMQHTKHQPISRIV
jgi:hypothetical protein